MTIPSAKETACIDFDKDTVEYRLDVKDDENKEAFLMTRCIVAEDSVFGGFNLKSIHRAFRYAKDKDCEPFLRYTVFEKTKGALVKLWDIDEMNVDNIYFPILEKGTVLQEKKDKDNNKYYVDGDKLLRVINKDSYALSVMCLNFRFENNVWVLQSRERIVTDPTDIHAGHCTDTTYLYLNTGERNVPKDRIDFSRSFLSLESNWKCNEQGHR